MIWAANKVAMLEPREWPHTKTDDPDLLTLHFAYSKTALHGKLMLMLITSLTQVGSLFLVYLKTVGEHNSTTR